MTLGPLERGKDPDRPSRTSSDRWKRVNLLPLPGVRLEKLELLAPESWRFPPSPSGKPFPGVETDDEQRKRVGRRPSGKRGTFSFRVTERLRGRLEQVARTEQRPVSEVISAFARLWSPIGSTFPRLSPARLRLLKTLSWGERRRPVRQYRGLVRNADSGAQSPVSAEAMERGF